MLKRFFDKNSKFISRDYWENRYQVGGNSGSGSYNNLAVFKAKVINGIVLENHFESVIEFGVGDGNQLSLMHYNRYLGLDVSPAAIKMCIHKFEEDFKKSFMIYDANCFKDPAAFLRGDIVLSLDVIYHLIEKEVYENYIKDIFSVANKMVIIYSTNELLPQFGGHEKHRVFTQDVETLIPGWKLDRQIKNKYTVEEYGEDLGSRANFYIYTK